MGGRPVASAQKVAVLQEAASSDFFGIFGCDEFFVQVIESLFKVPVHGLGHHRRVKVVRDGGGVGVTLVVQEQGVQHDVKRVHAELVLSSHCMHKLELHSFGSVVAEADQAPPIPRIIDFHHFGHIGLLEAARRHFFPRHAFRQKLHK